MIDGMNQLPAPLFLPKGHYCLHPSSFLPTGHVEQKSPGLPSRSSMPISSRRIWRFCWAFRPSASLPLGETTNGSERIEGWPKKEAPREPKKRKRPVIFFRKGFCVKFLRNGVKSMCFFFHCLMILILVHGVYTWNHKMIQQFLARKTTCCSFLIGDKRMRLP